MLSASFKAISILPQPLLLKVSPHEGIVHFLTLSVTNGSQQPPEKTFLTTIGQKETFFFIFIGETRHTCGEHIQSIGKLTNLSQMMVNRKE